ncbi:MAG: hypothetical protein ACI8RW_000082 [Porticoccaceae bacterium]|jgi:hypothetical protein
MVDLYLIAQAYCTQLLTMCRLTACLTENMMKLTYLEPTQEAGMDLFSRNIVGSVTMLNLLQF